MSFRPSDTSLVYSFKFRDKVTSMELRIKKIVFMSRHSFALLLSVIHKNILMSAYLMHIDVSINWRKTIHKSNFFSLKSQKKCTNNRVFPTRREWGGAPPNQPKFAHSSPLPLGKFPPVDSLPPNFYSLPTKSQFPHWSLVVLH